jgi:hypothetical protein
VGLAWLVENMRLGSTQLGTARLDGRCAVKRIPRRSCSDKNTYGAAGDLESRGCLSSGIIAATAGHQEMVLPPAMEPHFIIQMVKLTLVAIPCVLQILHGIRALVSDKPCKAEPSLMFPTRRANPTIPPHRPPWTNMRRDSI